MVSISSSNIGRSKALFDGAAAPETATAYRPTPLALHTVAQARACILQRLNAMPDGAPLDQLLPEEAPDIDDASRRAQLRRSGWAATFVGVLELAKQGDVVMAQRGRFPARPRGSSRQAGITRW